MTDEQADKPLRVSELQVTDFGGIKGVVINAEEDLAMVVITGPNGSGKTAMLRAMHAALTGARALPDKAIREGQTEAKVHLVLKDTLADRYAVDLKVATKKKGGVEPSLVVTDLRVSPPMRLAKPVAVLKQLVGDLAFNPRKFQQAGKEKQARMFLTAAGMAHDFDAAKARIDSAVETRKDAKKDAARLQTELAALTDPAPGDTLEEKNIDAATEKVTVANLRASDREHITEKGLDAKVRVQALEIQLEEAKRSEAAIGKQLVDRPAIDAEAAQAEVTAAQEHNERVRQQKAYLMKETDAGKADKIASGAESNVEALRTKLADLVSGCELAKQIPGLKIDGDSYITINDIPYEGCCGTEQLMLSTRIAIAANPTVRIMHVDEAGTLDIDSLRALAELAKETGHTVWATAPYPIAEEFAQSVQLADGELAKA